LVTVDRKLRVKKRRGDFDTRTPLSRIILN
jgi:hypothetical protein